MKKEIRINDSIVLSSNEPMYPTIGSKPLRISGNEIIIIEAQYPFEVKIKFCSPTGKNICFDLGELNGTDINSSDYKDFDLTIFSKRNGTNKVSIKVYK